VHGFDELLVVENVHQFVDCGFAVARAGLDISSEYVLSLLNRFGYAFFRFHAAVLH
jgi:hypothetical protein